MLHLRLTKHCFAFKKQQILNIFNVNQSRICGKGVGLGLFPSDSLQSQSYEFIEIAHIGPYYGVGNDCRIFRSNRMDSFCKNRKVAVFWPLLGYFWLFLTSQPYKFNEIAHKGP